MPSALVKEKALKTLDGMREIVEAEMLVRGNYITAVTKPERSGAICGGHKACLVGTEYVAYGIKPLSRRSYDIWHLPGVEPTERRDFMRNRPALRMTHAALNDAAEMKLSTLSSVRRRLVAQYREDVAFGEADDPGPAEAMFEALRLKREDILDVIAIARKTVESL